MMATELKFGYRIGRSTRLGPGVGPQGVCSLIRVKMLAEEHHFEIKFSSPYTPEENGPSERSNRVILEISRS